MTSEAGELLTHWTMRVAVAFYLARLATELLVASATRRNLIARRFWTLGLVIYLVHIACAFHFYHEWSHTDAYLHTAKQTATTVGIDWGGGLWFNYAFTVMWIVDAIAWYRRGDSEAAARWWTWTVQLVFAFMMFNATVVFGPPFWKWIGGVVICIFAFMYRQRSIREQSSTARRNTPHG